MPRCAHEGCAKKPNFVRFNSPDQTSGAYCAAHKLAGMVDVKSKRRCAHDGCTKMASYHSPGQTMRVSCSEHRHPGMVRVATRQCAHSGCALKPSYNAHGQTKGLYCKEHKSPGMVDVMNRRCAHEGCAKQPFYNEGGQTKGLWCSEHMRDGMVNVVTKRCEHEGCTKIPSFGVRGSAGASLCKAHATSGMVGRRRCSFEACDVKACFNLPGSKRGVRCAAHKTYGMIDVATRRCAHPDCTTMPTFAEPEQKTAVMCKKHRTATMASLNIKRCHAPACRALATYGKDEFHRAQYCADHKLETSVCIADALRCSRDGCSAQYEFVVESETGAHKVCLAHAPPGYEIALKRLCKYCDIREDVPFVCVTCRQRMHKKEHAVVRHLRRTIELPLIYDESPGFECTRKRPDIRFETPTHDVIVEVDENQHRQYQESCECARISEIVGALGGKSIAFVRYNPDAVRYGGKIHGVTAAERIDLLVETVNEEIQRASTEFEVRLVQLWYDAPVAAAKREMDITRLVAV